MPPDSVEASEMVQVVRNEDHPVPCGICQLRWIFGTGLSDINGTQDSVADMT
jgi:hypothetical protein